MTRVELFKRFAAVVLCAIGLGFSISGMTQDTEQMFWDSVRKADVVQEYRLYLKQFPRGAHAEDARKRLATLESRKKGEGVGTPGQESVLRAREESIKRREAEVAKTEADAEVNSENLRRRVETLQRLEESVAIREEQLRQREAVVRTQDIREDQLRQREAIVRAQEDQIKLRESMLFRESDEIRQKRLMGALAARAREIPPCKGDWLLWSNCWGSRSYASSGGRYSGEYRDGRPHGLGTMTNRDGTVQHAGQWVNGTPIP